MRPRASISLVTAGRAFVVAALIYAVVAAILSFSFLREIEADARLTREQQIPRILAQNVNAVKVERLSSLVRSAYLARDAQMERRIQVETRALAQSFSLDGDEVLVRGGKAIADGVKAIVALRAAERAAPRPSADDESVLRTRFEGAMHIARELAEHLTTDAALVADTMANKIEANVRSVGYAWMLILAVPAIGSLLFFWTFRTHVARPINALIDRLAAIGTQRFEERALPDPLFGELRMIATAVETYGQLSNELRRTNSVLQTLSHQDALTGVGNRRSLEAALAGNLGTAGAGGGPMTILLVDLDHFKRTNDRYGHQTGDACLKAVGALLGAFCSASGYHVARYGGEEFAILMPHVDLAAATAFAETLRLAIAGLSVPRPGEAGTVSITASIGLASGENDGSGDLTSDLIGAADAALYEAKRTGRNRVCRHESPVEAVRREQAVA